MRYTKPDLRPMGRFRALNRTGIYRDHERGEEFEERLSRRTARAIDRGDIEFLMEVIPGLPPGYTLPQGWLSRHPSTETPRGVSFVGGGS